MLRLLLLIGLVWALPAAAQPLRALHLDVDNDFFALRFSRAPIDRDYTSGLRLSADFGADRPAAPRLRVTLGQHLYTPRLVDEQPVPGERPFVGWLFVAARLERTIGPRVQRVGAEVGVTGPPALGEATQNTLHRVAGSRQRAGWEQQLAFEPAFVLYYGERLPLRVVPRYGIAVTPWARGSIGTRWTGATLGTSISVGGPALTLEAGTSGSFVARDMFLDGNTYRESVRAVKRRWRSEGYLGAHTRFGAWGVRVRFVTQSRAYEGQRAAHLYGSLGVSRVF